MCSIKSAAAASAKSVNVLLSVDVGAISLIRLPGVAAACGAGKSTILNWVRQGRFPRPVKFGNYTAWKSADVAAWCADPAGWVKAHTSKAEV
ncbi:helix-turn-helix transcriptional regulator [Bordetella sp.]|uniref:helix-turn-helix transcriptional regulator n=1 Tax=Bordetella sp. TaxID=28081 RepID=UPI0039C88271